MHSQNNHPPGIKKNIPLSVEKRLSKISSNADVFKEACQPYQEALSKAGYDHTLKFNPPEASQSRNRKRKVKFFNPPFSYSVKTNVGAKFLHLISTCFPKDHALHKIVNRNTVKVSYKCMPNMKSILSRHNSKILKSNNQNSDPPPCSHRGGTVCPLADKCKTTNVVYKATVTCDEQIETYTGLSEGPFQKRWENHKTDFRHTDKRTNTALAGHIWSLKDKDKNFTVNFEILQKAGAFNPISKKCMLCLSEKFHILYNPTGATLNIRSEFFNACRHKASKLLSLEKT